MKNETKYPMVTVSFNGLPSFRCLLSEWNEMGGYKGFLRDYGISIKSIKKVMHEVLPSSDYPSSDWAG